MPPRSLLATVSWLALAATILPSLLYYIAMLDLDQMNTVMLAAAVIWFLVTPLWMGREAEAATSREID